jgi:hypothetical protein
MLNLPLEGDETIEVLKHYFGITFDNELVRDIIIYQNEKLIRL